MKNQPDQPEQEANNREVFMKALKDVDPNLWVVASLLEETKVNPRVVMKIIHHLNKIAMGAGWGSVTTVLQNGIIKYVQGAETEKIEEPIISK